MGGKLRIYLLASFAAIGGWLFGFDTGTIGSITIMPQFVTHFQPGPTTTDSISPLLRGFLVSSILIPASLIGLIAGPISDRFSRTYTISLGAAVFSIGSAVCCASPTGKTGLGVLIFGRCVAGAGEGLFLSTVLVWTQEVSNLSDRGRLSAIQQVTINLGICLGFFVCYGSQHVPTSLSWRLPFALQSFFSLLLSLGSPILLPHTPNWLRMQGRTGEARKVLDLLHKSMREQEKEEILLGRGDVIGAGGGGLNDDDGDNGNNDGTGAEGIVEVTNGNGISSTNVDDSEVSRRKKAVRWKELFAKGNKGRTLLAIYLLASSQLSGIDAVLFYAPTLFTQAGLSAKSASFIASGVTGIVLTITSLSIQPLMDSSRFGRRPVTLVGGCGISSCLLVIGSLYASGAAKGVVGKWMIVALIELFVIFYVATWAMTLRPYATEISRPRTRAAVSSLAWAVNQGVNFIVAFTTPYFLAASSSGPYFLYSATSALTVVVGLFLMIETANRTMGNINDAWNERADFKFWKRRIEGVLKLVGGWFRFHHDQADDGKRGSDSTLAMPAIIGDNLEMDNFRRREQDDDPHEKKNEELDEDIIMTNEVEVLPITTTLKNDNSSGHEMDHTITTVRERVAVVSAEPHPTTPSW